MRGHLCVLSHKYFSNASMGRKISGNHDDIFIYGVCTESRNCQRNSSPRRYRNAINRASRH